MYVLPYIELILLLQRLGVLFIYYVYLLLLLFGTEIVYAYYRVGKVSVSMYLCTVHGLLGGMYLEAKFDREWVMVDRFYKE